MRAANGKEFEGDRPLKSQSLPRKRSKPEDAGTGSGRENFLSRKLSSDVPKELFRAALMDNPDACVFSS